ncbi:restriction endonuclease subunit S [Pseudomonas syringae]|uniref:restriction endonuclease subunit S n=1 Tax=Pseudomonas syringae TaxID=317 RepID=UPI003F78DE67
MIPEDWSTPCLGQLTHSVEYGSSAKSRPSGKTPVLRMGNLRDGSIDWRDLVFTNNDAEIKKYLLSSGDVLFNRTNTIDLVGKTAIYKGERPAIFAGYLIRVNENKSLLDSRFLNYVLNAEFSKKYSLKVLSVAVGQANINGQKLKTYPVPLPPTLAEQQAIAEALSNADALIESLEEMLTKKRQIKQGAMRELLTGQRRLPGFSGGWETKRLDQLADIRSGGTPSTYHSEYWDGDILWCTPTDITGLNGHKYLSDTNRKITSLGLRVSSAELIPEHSIIMTSRATIGECAINLLPLCTNQGFKNFMPFDGVNTEFLYYLLSAQKQKFISLCGGSTFLEIGKSQLGVYEVQIPELKEQTVIASILSAIDAELTTLGTKLQKARDLKQGLMQELLTGRIRLV